MNGKTKKNPRADEKTKSVETNYAASANGATGMMYSPAHNRQEYESLKNLHGLQSTEFAQIIDDDDGRDFHERNRENILDEYNSELSEIDPDINYINSHDDYHASMRPFSFVDFSNGETEK